jgi:hypothetical protein
MNDNKLKQLFAAARKDSTPPLTDSAAGNFAADVLRAVRLVPPPKPAESATIFERLDALFPRIAVAAVAVIILCVAADWGLTAAGLPGVSDGAAQLTSQYLFNATPEDL